MDIFEYAEDIILSMGGNGADVEQITEEIKENGYTTIEEVKSHLEKYYTEEFWGEEICPHCDYVNNFTVRERVTRITCKKCGKRILLCSLCEMETGCGKCPYEKEE